MDDPPYTESSPAAGEEEPLTSETPAAEVPPGMENQTAWDDPPSQSGVQYPTLRDDQDDPAATMVEQGIEEADRELRLEAETDEETEEEA